ncbi:MAG: SpoIIE family protein phosphatase [Planctomycetota bacterium]
MSAQKKQGAGGKLAVKVGLVCAAAGAVAGALTVVAVVQTLGSAISSQNSAVITRGWLVGMMLAVISGLAVGLVAYLQGSQIGGRLTELGIGLAKIGRGTGEVRIRYSGTDEVSKLGRALQYLASDLAAVAAEAEQGGGLGASSDPQMRQLRDRTLPTSLPEVEGFEIDGTVAPGTRGGMDYYDCVEHEGQATVFLVSAEGAGAASAIAARMARDEIHRALRSGANARKALYHTNRVLHRQLPKGTCAKATLVSLEDDEVKVYQAGDRSPVLVCRAGEAYEEAGEGLALGLDEGPVFEKGLRRAAVAMAQGVRLVMANEAAHRLEGFVDHVVQHSPKHTAPFMNLVLGGLESEAGEGGLREDVVLLTAKRW